MNVSDRSRIHDTDFGETTFLERKDESIVVVYDATRFDARAIESRARREGDAPADGISLLRQAVT